MITLGTYVPLWEEFINKLEENIAAIQGVEHEQFKLPKILINYYD